MAPLIVAQFAFAAGRVFECLKTLRARGLDVPVQLAISGLAGIRTLMRFAARCGVEASTVVLANYCISVGKVFGSTGHPEHYRQRTDATRIDSSLRFGVGASEGKPSARPGYAA